MKKLLLLFLPVALLLTSCLGSDSEPTTNPDETIFYSNFMLIHNHGGALTNMLDEFIKMYEQNGDNAQGITVVIENDGTATLTADLDVINDYYTEYKDYGGTLVAKLSGFTSALSEATEKSIDVNALKYIDAYYNNYVYGGKVSITDDGTDRQLIQFISFSIGTAGSADKVWSIDYSYTYSYDPVAKTYTWSEGYGLGTYSSYGSFSVMLTEDVVKKENLSFVSSGCYTFMVQYIGNGLPFMARYGGTSGGNSGTVTITTTDGVVHEYQQNG